MVQQYDALFRCLLLHAWRNKERTVGLVTAKEFREAREAADSLEEAEAKRRQEKEVEYTLIIV